MSFSPTLTAWKFIPKMAGLGALCIPLCVLPLIFVQNRVNLELVVAAECSGNCPSRHSTLQRLSGPGGDGSQARRADLLESS